MAISTGLDGLEISNIAKLFPAANMYRPETKVFPEKPKFALLTLTTKVGAVEDETSTTLTLPVP